MNTDQDDRDDCHLSATELTIAGVWEEVLQVPAPSRPEDNFFELGGDSMTMVMTEFRILEEFSVELPAGTLMSSPTLRELSTLVDEQRAGPDDAT